MQIGLIKVVAESASAAGVRRIEALTADAARDYLSEQDAHMKGIASLLKAKPEDAMARVSALMDERKKLERDLNEARKKLALGGGSGGADNAVKSFGDIKLMAKTVTGVAPKDLRGLVDDGKNQIGSGIVAIIAVSDEGKAGIVVGVTKDLTDDHSAVDLVKVGAAALGGKGGGGRPDMAQAGGPDGAKADDAIKAIEAHVAAQTGA